MKINKTLSALSDPTRRKILDLLKKSDMSAGAIGKNFGITAPSLSHHLGVLREAGLVISERNGQEIIYSLNVSVFEEVAELLIGIFNTKK
jgi:DNA-binding transcriptional ArsR family regulator